MAPCVWFLVAFADWIVEGGGSEWLCLMGLRAVDGVWVDVFFIDFLNRLARNIARPFSVSLV